jgi:hypothetical protein
MHKLTLICHVVYTIQTTSIPNSLARLRVGFHRSHSIRGDVASREQIREDTNRNHNVTMNGSAQDVEEERVSDTREA